MVVLAAVVFVAVANASIALAVPVTRAAVGVDDPGPLPGITHLRAVDDGLWRGDAPSEESYRALARHAVSTVVDLRAERDVRLPHQVIDEAGLRVVRIPIRDGQTPTPEQVARFLAVARDAPGRVYVHCGAGVGRAGTMAGTYLVQVAGEAPASALLRNMSVGPPSVEQLWYVGTQAPGVAARQPPAPVSWLSRALDAPRRIWSRLT